MNIRLDAVDCGGLQAGAVTPLCVDITAPTPRIEAPPLLPQFAKIKALCVTRRAPKAALPQNCLTTKTIVRLIVAGCKYTFCNHKVIYGNRLSMTYLIQKIEFPFAQPSVYSSHGFFRLVTQSTGSHLQRVLSSTSAGCRAVRPIPAISCSRQQVPLATSARGPPSCSAWLT